MAIVGCRQEGKDKFLYFITYGAYVRYQTKPTLADIRNDIKQELNFHPMREKPEIIPEKDYRKKMQVGKSFSVHVTFNEKQGKAK